MKNLGALLVVLFFSAPVMAQNDPLDLGGASNRPQAGSNPLGSTDPNGLDIFSLVHRSNLANPKSSKEFKEESGKDLDDAVAKFRNRSPLQITPTALQLKANPTPTSTEPVKP